MDHVSSYKLIRTLACFACVICLGACAWAQTLAFPQAEGGGKFTKHGRGGQIIRVTTLADAGPGSLREALTTPGKRIIVFDVGGTIHLETTIMVTEPYFYIAGQTAPGGGICIRAAANWRGYQGPEYSRQPLLWVKTKEGLFRFLRFRAGPAPAAMTDKGEGWTNNINFYRTGAGDGITENFVIDHCSFSFGTDKNLTVYRNVRNFTVQWSLFSHSLQNSTNPEGKHSTGLILVNAVNSTISHNVFAHNAQRNPEVEGEIDITNNIIYNPNKVWAPHASTARFVTVNDDDYAIDIYGTKLNYVNNHFIPGPNTQSNKMIWAIVRGEDNGTINQQIHLSGNVAPTSPNGELSKQFNMIKLVDLISSHNPSKTTLSVSNRINVAPTVTTWPVAENDTKLLAQAGCVLPTRDSYDAQVMKSIQDRSGSIINHPDQVGGWPVLADGSVPTDNDNDGMADEWENANGLDPTDPHDGKQDANGNGYTNVEEYLESLVPVTAYGIQPNRPPVAKLKIKLVP